MDPLKALLPLFAVGFKDDLAVIGDVDEIVGDLGESIHQPVDGIVFLMGAADQRDFIGNAVAVQIAIAEEDQHFFVFLNICGILLAGGFLIGLEPLIVNIHLAAVGHVNADVGFEQSVDVAVGSGQIVLEFGMLFKDLLGVEAVLIDQIVQRHQHAGIDHVGDLSGSELIQINVRMFAAGHHQVQVGGAVLAVHQLEVHAGLFLIVQEHVVGGDVVHMVAPHIENLQGDGFFGEREGVFFRGEGRHAHQHDQSQKQGNESLHGDTSF